MNSVPVLDTTACTAGLRHQRRLGHRGALIILCHLMVVAAGLSVFYYDVPTIGIPLTPIRILVVLGAMVGAISVLGRGKFSGNILLLLLACLFLLYAIVRAVLEPTDSVGWSLTQIRDPAFFFATFFLTYGLALRVPKRHLENACIWGAIIWGVLGCIWVLTYLRWSVSAWEIISDYNLPNDRILIGGYQIGSLTIPRLAGAVSDPNLFAYSLCLPLLWVIYRHFSPQAPEGSESPSLLPIALLAPFLLLTLSRSGIAIALLALLVLVLYLRPNPAALGKLFFASVASLVLADVLIRLGSGHDLLHIFLARFNVDGNGPVLGVGRSIRLSAGLAAFKSSPIVGVGPGNLVNFLPASLRNPEELTAHSWFLDLMVNYGLIGLFLMALFFGAVISVAWKGRSRGPRDYAFVMAIWLTAVLLGQLVYSNFWHPVFASQLALALAATRPTAGGIGRSFAAAPDAS